MKGHLLNLYKNVGETPLERLARFRKTHPEYRDVSLSFAGRLDPMAEGVLLVLVGPENKSRTKYLGLPKTYMLEIVFGIETDTYDILGIPSALLPADDETPAHAVSMVGKYITTFAQPYPAYSSRTVQGKPLFQWAREGRLSEIRIPEKNVTISSIEILSQNSISSQELSSIISARIAKTNGDFRQDEILSAWNKILPGHKSVAFPVLKIGVSCSSGTYMRSLAHAIGKDVGTGACALSIMRTSIGNHQASDALID